MTIAICFLSIQNTFDKRTYFMVSVVSESTLIPITTRDTFQLPANDLIKLS